MQYNIVAEVTDVCWCAQFLNKVQVPHVWVGVHNFHKRYKVVHVVACFAQQLQLSTNSRT